MQPLIVLTGPTAAGKTALSLKLAQSTGGEIISADSVQVYRGMDIGSAKIRPEEMQGVRHHLIDILDPDEAFDVVRFRDLAKEAVGGIAARGNLPVVAGGTGFYIQALLKDVAFEEEDETDDLRRQLEERSAAGETQALYEELCACDPDAARAIHPHNTRRVIRALEFYRRNGYPISQHNAKAAKQTSPYRYCYFVLTQDRGALYERINRRVDQMMEDGLLREVCGLREAGYGPELPSMKAIGYRELNAYLDGQYDLETAVTLIKRNTRHFAKRQLTWFRRERDVILLEREAFRDETQILDELLRICRERNII